MKISAVVFSKDSEMTIGSCLKSLKWVDDLVVVDMGSEDNTLKLARKYTKNIITVKNVGFVEPVRNEGVDKAIGDWILVLDADEEITVDLRNKLGEVIYQKFDVWELSRKNLILDEWMKDAGWWPDYQSRFFRKGCLKWKNKIHSKPIVKGKVSRFEAEEKLAIIHHNYQSVEEYVDRLNKYTSIEAKQSSDKNVSGIDTNIAFMSDYFRRLYKEKGYKAGDMGMILSVMQAYYQFLVKVKVWEREKRKKDTKLNDLSNMSKSISSQMSYWVADFEVSNQTNIILKNYWRIRRKLKI